MAKKSMKTMARAEEVRNRQQTNPLSVPRTIRGHQVRTFTSLPAGKCVPIAAVPLLREDAVRRGVMSFSFEMHETAEIIMNGVLVRVQAHVVPWLAFEKQQKLRETMELELLGAQIKNINQRTDYYAGLGKTPQANVTGFVHDGGGELSSAAGYVTRGAWVTNKDAARLAAGQSINPELERPRGVNPFPSAWNWTRPPYLGGGGESYEQEFGEIGGSIIATGVNLPSWVMWNMGQKQHRKFMKNQRQKEEVWSKMTPYGRHLSKDMYSDLRRRDIQERKLMQLINP